MSNDKIQQRLGLMSGDYPPNKISNVCDQHRYIAGNLLSGRIEIFGKSVSTLTIESTEVLKIIFN